MNRPDIDAIREFYAVDESQHDSDVVALCDYVAFLEADNTELRALRMKQLDDEMNDIGFYGYDGCPHLEQSGCPSAFLCSEKGDCSEQEPSGWQRRWARA